MCSSGFVIALYRSIERLFQLGGSIAFVH